MSHFMYATSATNGNYRGICSVCGFIYLGNRDWVLARMREHEADYSTPKFTGFDGIPDWTEKDSEIALLRRENANNAAERIRLAYENDDLTKKVEDLKDAYARMQSSAVDDLLRAKLSYQKLRTEVWRAATDIRRVKADPTLRFSTEEALSVLEERMRGWL